MEVTIFRPVNVEFNKIETMSFIRYCDDSSWKNINSEDGWIPCKKDGSDLPCLAEDYLSITIDIETGTIDNWPKDNNCYHIFSKVRDKFYTIIRDKNTNEVILSYEGYVPSFMAIEDEGYGDYIDFIVENGTIRNWSFTKKHFNEMLENNFDN